MRRLFLSDLHHAACALRGLPNAAQSTRMRDALIAAQIADRYRKRLGKAHPEHGTGTLSSALGPVTEPSFCDTAYLRAMQSVIAALLDRAAP